MEKFIGDAVMALFGAPVAHEDDPERAVRAALAIRDAIGAADVGGRAAALRVRIGVTTGEALVSVDARPEAGEGMASGDVVNTAASRGARQRSSRRRADAAGNRTGDRVRGCRPGLGKGEEGTRARMGGALPAGSRWSRCVQSGRSPLIGRERELRQLLDGLARAHQERSPQLVTLVGVPGIGKSRLVWELFLAVDQSQELVRWRQGRSLPYGAGFAFWALGEIVKAEAGILDTDSAAEAEGKLADAASTAGPAERGWVLGHLRGLVGVAVDDGRGDRRGEAFAAWRLFLESLADERPLVLVFEDLHWADEGLLDFVDYVADRAEDVPLSVVATARPELLDRRPAWGGGKLNAQTVALPAMSEGETARLLAALLDLPAPESLQGIIAARLDGLPAAEKELLENAAVVGKVFWTGALTAVGEHDRFTLDDRLRVLARKDFLRRVRRSTVAGETEYAFPHVLVRDVAYGLLPRAERVEKHRQIAGWLEQLSAERSEDVAEMLAYHYGSALEYARAIGRETEELRGRARHAFAAAGDRASALSAFPPAVGFYRSALELWERDDAARASLLLRLGKALHHAGEGGETELAEAGEELARQGDREAAADAETLLTWALHEAGDQERSERHLARGGCSCGGAGGLGREGVRNGDAGGHPHGQGEVRSGDPDRPGKPRHGRGA